MGKGKEMEEPANKEECRLLNMTGIRYKQTQSAIVIYTKVKIPTLSGETPDLISVLSSRWLLREGHFSLGMSVHDDILTVKL